MNTLSTLLQKISHAKHLDFGNIFNACISLFKKVWLQGLIVLILNAVLMFPLIFIVYLPMISLGILSPETFSENTDFSELNGASVFMIAISVFLFLIMFVLGITLSVALKAAYYRIVRNKDLELNESDDYFFYLKRKYFKKTMGLSLMMAGIAILALLLFVLPIFYVLIPLYYMVVIYAMNPDLTPSEIVKAGFQLGNAKWGITFGLLVIAWILSTFIGLLMCFIGIYVTQQFMNLPAYQIYKDIIGFDEKSDIDKIGEIENL